MTIQPNPAIRFNASQKPWELSYPLTLTTTGQQDQLIFTALKNRIYVIKTWVWFYSSGTCTDKSAIFKTHSATNYQFASFATLAMNYPHTWQGEGWFEYPDTVSFRCNVSTATVNGSLYLTGLQFVKGEGAFD